MLKELDLRNFPEKGKKQKKYRFVMNIELVIKWSIVILIWHQYPQNFADYLYQSFFGMGKTIQYSNRPWIKLLLTKNHLNLLAYRKILSIWLTCITACNSCDSTLSEENLRKICSFVFFCQWRVFKLVHRYVVNRFDLAQQVQIPSEK